MKALELFNHRYSEDERFSWLEMIDFAEAYASQSKEECANYAHCKAVTDAEIEDAFPMKYSEAVGSAHNILQLARRSGAKWMREQQGDVSELEYAEHKCQCKESTGSTAIDCCNVCGYPLQSETWHFIKPTPQGEGAKERYEKAVKYLTGSWKWKVTDMRHAPSTKEALRIASGLTDKD